MSQYITMFITKNISYQQINTMAARYNLVFMPISNSFIEGQVKNRESNYYLAEWRESEFGTAIPSHLENNKIFSFDFDGELSEYIFKQAFRREQAVESCINNWYCFLFELFSINKNQVVGMMTHWYKDTFEKEQVIIKNVIKKNLHDFKESYVLDNMEEDILYLIG